MSERRSFIDLCLAGEALLEDVDDFVDQWHAGVGDQELREFLGMNKNEYSLWLTEPGALAYIVKARREAASLKQLVRDNYSVQRLAARSSGDQKSKRLLRWLEQEGKLLD